MKKITFLALAILFSTSTLFAQEKVSALGENNPVIYVEQEQSKAPCTQTNPSNAFENGLNITNGSQFQVANDFDVDPLINYTLENITANIFNTGGISSVTVTYYDDNGGIPGNVVGSEAGVVPSSQNVIGNNFGIDVREVVLDITPVVFAGGATTTKYWIELSAVTSGDAAFWETTTVSFLGADSALNDSGAGWNPQGNDGVYNFSGDCSAQGPNTTCGFAQTAVLGINNAIGMDNTDAGAVDGCYSTGTDALWYTFTADETGELTITSDINGQTQDTRLSVYDTCTDLNCIGNNDDGGTGFTSLLTLALEAGQTIYLEWDDRWSDADFDFELSYVVTCPTPGDLAISNDQGTSVDLSWTDDAEAVNGYSVMVFNAGADPDVDTPVFSDVTAAGVTTINVTGLSEDTDYDAYVMADCDTGGTSGRSLVTFTTIILPPSNDDPENATMVNCGDNVSGQTDTATDSGGSASGDVFFSYTGPGSAEDITVSLCGGSTDYDSRIRVYDSVDLSNEIAQNDDFCGLQSELTFTSDGTTTYYIMIEGFGSSTGNFVMDITCESLAVAENQIEGLSIYPNPTRDLITVSARDNVEQIEIFNLLGQRVFMQKAGNTTASFDISGLSAGNYIMRATVGGQIGNYQIVKR